MTAVIKPLTFEDKEGVRYFISAGGTVYIELPTDKKKKAKNPYRKIGHYDFYSKTFTKKEKSDTNAVYYKLQAFGFPYHLLKRLHTDQDYGLEKVIVEFPKFEAYEIDANLLFKEGYFLKQQFRNYKNKGLELRLYVPIKYFSKTNLRSQVLEIKEE